MRKILLLLIIILQIFSSCQKSKFENLLVNPDKRWVYLDSGQVRNKAKASSYTKFFANGDCENRFISNDQKSFFSIDGNEKNDGWKYSSNDSILMIYNNRFKILKYESDTIHMLLLKKKWRKMLVNYKHQNHNN